MSGSNGKSPQEIARDEAVKQIVGTLCYVVVIGAVSWAISNRDILWRVKHRIEQKWRSRGADPYAAEVAEFRREINNLSRGTEGPDTAREPGLYEHG